ncbi:MAG: hypothetical protein NTX65_03990 [Ignavibacteriales bacterium]|nr:hypothetical protein [Ignavibacteriales bacterium]
MWRSFGLFFSLMILFAIGIKGQKCGEPIKLNKGPQLFIDDYLIADQSFLLRTVNNPQKLSNPILVGGLKNDLVWQPYLSVLRDPDSGMFRLWYNTPVDTSEVSRCHIGYMESKDGINWIRPPRILKDPHEIQFGVKVLDLGKNYSDKEKRFVLATYLKPGYRVSTSPDGYSWTPISDKPVFLHNHDITSLFWDPIRKQFLATVSHRQRGFGDPSLPKVDDIRRIPHETVSKDLINWETIWPIITPKIGVPLEVGETQFYSMSGIIERGDLLIGLVKVLRDDLNATYGKSAKEMGDKDRKAAGIGYTVLAWSRDGRTWERDYEPFIPNNPIPGTFDHAMAWGDEQIIVGDETYVYYGGYESGHKVNRFNERHIGFAKMLIDRYVSRDADLNTGTLITKPLIINAESLTVNAKVKGEFRLRLLDINREPIKGFDWVELKGDSVEHKVEWAKKIDSLAGTPVCIEFQLKNAQLFGFYLH